MVDVAAAEHLQPCDDGRGAHGQNWRPKVWASTATRPARRDHTQTEAATSAAEDPAVPACRVERRAGQRGASRTNIEISDDTELQMVVSARHRRCGPTATIAGRKPGSGAIMQSTIEIWLKISRVLLLSVVTKGSAAQAPRSEQGAGCPLGGKRMIQPAFALVDSASFMPRNRLLAALPHDALMCLRPT